MDRALARGAKHLAAAPAAMIRAPRTGVLLLNWARANDGSFVTRALLMIRFV